MEPSLSAAIVSVLCVGLSHGVDAIEDDAIKEFWGRQKTKK
jgi:hypothetical protein